jgi:Signal peptidase, peptidase S26
MTSRTRMRAVAGSASVLALAVAVWVLRRTRDWMIKRVVALPGDPWPDGPARGPSEQAVPAGCFAVHGDNPAGSFDSRVFGYCPADRLLGVVVRPMRR